MCAANIQVPDNQIILKLLHTVILQLYDLQGLTLWKDLDPDVNIVPAQETGSILKIGFALSKRGHRDALALQKDL